MKNFLFAPKLVLLLGIACIAALIWLLILASFASDADSVRGIMNIMWVPGLVGAVALGLWFAMKISQGINAPEPKRSLRLGGATMFSLIGAGILWYTQKVGASGGFPLVELTLALLSFMFAGLVWHYARPGRTAPKALRYLIILAAFAAGALPGLVLYVIFSFIVSDIYCRLTSSKCM